jgi:hypothetical protein
MIESQIAIAKRTNIAHHAWSIPKPNFFKLDRVFDLGDRKAQYETKSASLLPLSANNCGDTGEDVDFILRR